MKMTTGLIIAILILISSIGLYACKGKIKGADQENKNVKKQEVADNPYLGLRQKAFSVTPDQLGIELDNDKDIYGLVMDWNLGDAVVSVVSFKTGDASVYLSSGQAFIGGYGHETVVRAAKQFVIEGNKYLKNATIADNTEVTEDHKVNFYFLTKSGKYYLEEDLANIENETSDLSKLFEAGNQVISEYRLISGSK